MKLVLIFISQKGAFYTCDDDYKNQLRDIFRQHLGNDIVLFTTGNNFTLNFEKSSWTPLNFQINEK